MFAQNEAYALGYLCGWVMWGPLAGLLPLILGLARNQQGLAWGGFAACVVSGVGSLFLAGPVALVFTVIILATPTGNRRPRRYRDYEDDYDGRDDRRRRFRADEDWRRYDDEDRPRSREGDRRERDDRQGGKGFGYRESDDY